MKKRMANYLGGKPDYSKYPAGLSGFTGVDPHRIYLMEEREAHRSRIGNRGLYKTALAQLPNGNLIVTPCRHPHYPGAKVKGKFRLEIYISSDEGKTWGKIADGPEGKEPSLTALGDGTLILTTQTPGEGLKVFRSEDSGITWQRLNLPGEIEIHQPLSYPRSILKDPDDTVYLFISKGSYWEPSSPPGKGWVLISKDKGKSWQVKEVCVWEKGENFFEEISIIRLPNKNLLATFRVSGNHMIEDIPPPRGLPTPEGDESGNFMLIMESEDNGIHLSLIHI